MQINEALDQGLTVRGVGLTIYAEDPEGKRVADIPWLPEEGSDLAKWLSQGNTFHAVRRGLVRFMAMGIEAVRAPADLLEAIKTDGQSRVWMQGGYTFGLAKDPDDGEIKIGLVGIPEGGSAKAAWHQQVTKHGAGTTFEEAVQDAFDQSLSDDS